MRRPMACAVWKSRQAGMSPLVFSSSQRALRKLEGVALVTFFVLLAMSWGALFALYQAGA